MTIQSAARIALTKFLCLKQGEKVLVVYDEKKEDIANAFVSEAKKLTYRVDSVLIPIPAVSGVEPPDDVSERMKQYDVIVIPTSKSISHTNARKDACRQGARIASMPGITEEMMERSLDVNPEEIIKLGNKIIPRLKGKKFVRITTKKGTDITMIAESGEWDNLPAGEVCLSPVEGTAKGVLVIDKSMAGIGTLKSPIKVIVEKGLVTRISGGVEAGKLKKLLANANDPGAYNIAELGIGTNPKAIVTGNILEDEKAIGTAHIAFGNNASLGGKVEVELHLDGVFSSPTITADSETIIKDGKILD
jgi:aminopeptidase